MASRPARAARSIAWGFRGRARPRSGFPPRASTLGRGMGGAVRFDLAFAQAEEPRDKPVLEVSFLLLLLVVDSALCGSGGAGQVRARMYAWPAP